MRFLVFLLSVLSSSPAWAAPVFSSATSSNHDTVTYATHDHTATPTADRLMLFCVAHSYSGTEAVTSVFYNTTQEATAVANVIAAVGSSRLWLYALINPANGLHAVEVSFNELVLASIGVMTFTGAHQTTALGTAATSGIDAVTDVATNVSSAIDDLVADCLLLVDSALTITNGSQTERFLTVFPDAWQLNGTTVAGASPTVTGIRDWGGGLEYAPYIGISIKPAAAAVARRRSPSFQ